MSGTAALGRGEIFVNPAPQPKRVARTIVLNQIQGQRRRTRVSVPHEFARFGGASAYLPLATGAGASDAPLLGDQEILREGPIVIDPLGLAVETCLGGDLE